MANQYKEKVCFSRTFNLKCDIISHCSVSFDILSLGLALLGLKHFCSWTITTTNCVIVLVWSNLRFSATKPTTSLVRPAKNQISLGIRPVWSESLLSTWRNLGSLATNWACSKDSDQIRVFAGRMWFCWFWRVVAHICHHRTKVSGGTVTL